MELDAFDAFMDFLLYVFAFSILASGTVLGLGIIRARIRR